MPAVTRLHSGDVDQGWEFKFPEVSGCETKGGQLYPAFRRKPGKIVETETLAAAGP